MRTKTLLLTLSLVVGCFFAAHSQSTYKSAIGLRAGYPVAVTFKQFLFDQGAIEAFAGYRGYVGYGWFVTGITYQHHFPFTIGSLEGFHWFIGGGAGVYFWNYNYTNDLARTSVGILAVGGVDYKFEKIPLNVTADIMPAFFVGSNYRNGYSRFQAGLGALSARYTFR